MLAKLAGIFTRVKSRAVGRFKLLSSIKGKLLLAISSLQIAVLIAAILATAWVFDRGLETYQASVEKQRLTPIVVALSEAYQSHNNDWQWLAKDRCFLFGLINKYLFDQSGPAPRCADENGKVSIAFDSGAEASFKGPSPQRGQEHDPQMGPPPQWSGEGQGPEPGQGRFAPPGQGDGQMDGPPERFDDRGAFIGPAITRTSDDGSLLSPMLRVFDANGEQIMGPPQEPHNLQFKPILAGGKVVGYLGYEPRTMLGQNIVNAFKQQQLWGYLVVLIVAMVMTVGVALVLTRWFGTPMEKLAVGTRALIRGEHGIKVDIAGNDEFAHLAKDFNRLSEALYQNREANQQWIADIAHDLRTPMSVLKGELEALQDGIRKWTPQTVDSLIVEVENLVRLVDDLHVLSVSEVGAVNYQLKSLNFSQLLWRSLELHSQGLSRKGIRLTVNVKNNLWVVGDSSYLSRLLDNLMKNTLAYTEAPGKLHVELVDSGSELFLHWSDSSPGVSDASLKRLTERLYRDERSRNKGSGGSGLGLAIAEAIVQAHHGHMQADHSPMGGLSWIIRLPLEESHEYE
ncbi:signal transduction histidine kinase [Gallaecimonas pentaromativorans]|uniref:histidine kinase n=1 Tax=Gallaecimonas pentaromativorans TaxID=584787 RepID=A0A3N1PVD0_9GAMM|nr:signal transduction histidine kinase [Gallaecimonas pentaromativorans]